MFHGMETVPEDWVVKEDTATLYVRSYFVTGGSVIYADRFGKLKLQENHLYLFPTNLPYEMLQDKNDRLSCIFFHRTIAPLIVPRLVALSAENHPFVAHITGAMTEGIYRERKGDGREMGKIVDELAELLIRYVEDLGLLETLPSGLSGAVEYVNIHFREDLRVEQLAELACYHPKYFIRKFREAMGISPHGYLVRCRLEAACGRLLLGESVADTAEYSGYGDVKSFSRAFRRHFGMSPGRLSHYTKPI